MVAAFALALRCLGSVVSRVLAAKASGTNVVAVQVYGGCCASLYREARGVLGGTMFKNVVMVAFLQT